MKESDTPDWYPQAPLVPHTPEPDMVSKDRIEIVNHETRKPERSSTSKITGRLAYTPTFKEYPNGRFSMRTQIAIHDETGATTFFGAYSTKDYARRLQRHELKRGDLVELTGVWQQNPVKKADGTVKIVPVFYCYGAKVR